MQDALFPTLVPGALFHGRYRVVRSLKAGGMGAVYEVFDERVDGRRALKVMLPSILEQPEFRERFVREARFAGSIDSDHIVRVSDAAVDEATGTPFLVMELLEGEELGRLAARGRALPHGEVVGYLFQAALGLDKAHAKGIVHRDLKPENLFVTRRDDGSPCVKILDFGIAKAVAQDGDAKATLAVGTPKYMAPEQIRGDGSLGPRADVYALAHVAYTLLAGEAYWSEEAKASLFLLMGKIVAGAQEPPVARALRRGGVVLPPAFDAWFFKATAVDPAQRFDRATVCIAALGDVLGARGPLLSAPSSEPSVALAATGATPISGSGSQADATGGGRTTRAVTTDPLARAGRRAIPVLALSVIMLACAVMIAVFLFRRPGPEAVPAVTAATSTARVVAPPPAPQPMDEPSVAPSSSTSAPVPALPVSTEPAMPSSRPRPRPAAPGRPTAAPKPPASPAPRPKDTIE